MARGLLESAGLEAWLASDDAGGAYPFQLSGGGVQLIVEAGRGRRGGAARGLLAHVVLGGLSSSGQRLASLRAMVGPQVPPATERARSEEGNDHAQSTRVRVRARLRSASPPARPASPEPRPAARQPARARRARRPRSSRTAPRTGRRTARWAIRPRSATGPGKRFLTGAAAAKAKAAALAAVPGATVVQVGDRLGPGGVRGASAQVRRDVRDGEARWQLPRHGHPVGVRGGRSPPGSGGGAASAGASSPTEAPGPVTAGPGAGRSHRDRGAATRAPQSASRPARPLAPLLGM